MCLAKWKQTTLQQYRCQGEGKTTYVTAALTNQRQHCSSVTEKGKIKQHYSSVNKKREIKQHCSNNAIPNQCLVCVTMPYSLSFSNNAISHQRCLCDAVLFISIQHHTTPTFSLCDAVLVISIQHHTTPPLSRCEAVLLTVAFRDGRTVRLG